MREICRRKHGVGIFGIMKRDTWGIFRDIGGGILGDTGNPAGGYRVREVCERKHGGGIL